MRCDTASNEGQSFGPTVHLNSLDADDYLSTLPCPHFLGHSLRQSSECTSVIGGESLRPSWARRYSHGTGSDFGGQTSTVKPLQRIRSEAPKLFGGGWPRRGFKRFPNDRHALEQSKELLVQLIHRPPFSPLGIEGNGRSMLTVSMGPTVTRSWHRRSPVATLCLESQCSPLSPYRC